MQLQRNTLRPALWAQVPTEAQTASLANPADQVSLPETSNESGHDEKPELFSISDASNLVNYVDNSVDTILSFETLEHLENPEKALQEYYRVCRKNLILTVPNCEVTNGMLDSGLIYKTWVDRTHIQFFDLKTIVSLAEEVGFQVIQKTYINEVSLLPLLFEAFDFSDILGKIARKIIRLKSEKAKKYYITCLLVCEKKNP